MDWENEDGLLSIQQHSGLKNWFNKVLGNYSRQFLRIFSLSVGKVRGYQSKS